MIRRRKARGFRLGRRLVKIWRWALRRRPRRNYLRLEHSPLLSPYHSQPTSLCRKRSTTALATKLVHWARSLTRHLQPSALWQCTSPRGGGRGERHRILGGGAGEAADESKPPPKGHLAVYVGGDKDSNGVGGSKRYVVPVLYFNHPLFGELLHEAEEEFGFHHPGGITIPCPVARFERVQTCIASAARRPT